jgi:hypothetical protein
MAGKIGLLMPRHLFVRHAGEIIVGLVVLAHMLEAIAVILTFLPAALRRRIESQLDAILPITGGRGFVHQPVVFRLHPQAVEKFRVEFHAQIIMGAGHGQNKHGRTACEALC